MNSQSNNIVAIIPARSGSKTIPKKNIIPFGPFHLIAYSIAIARLSKKIQKIVVSTDSKEIANIARLYGAEVPFLRPASISKDNSKDIELFKHYVNFCLNNGSEIPEYIVHLSPTVPLREIYIVDNAIETLINSSLATSLRSVHETSIPPQKMFHIKNGFLKGFFPSMNKIEYYNYPRQDFPNPYIPNGHVDIVKPSVFMAGEMLHGEKILAYITKRNPDIDSFEDYDEAIKLLKHERYKHLIDFIKMHYSN